MNFTKTNTIYIVELNYKMMNNVKHVSRFRYDSREKAGSAIQHFKKELGKLIDCITLTKEELEIL